MFHVSNGHMSAILKSADLGQVFSQSSNNDAFQQHFNNVSTATFQTFQNNTKPTAF